MAPFATSTSASKHAHGTVAMSASTSVATSEEDGGFTGQRLAMLAAHLFFSVAHIFAVHQSAEPHDDEAKAAAQAASLAGDNSPEAKGRGYRYSPAMVVLLVRPEARRRNIGSVSLKALVCARGGGAQELARLHFFFFFSFFFGACRL